MPSQEQKNKFYKILTTARKANILHPEVITAQWALESGWGAYESGRFNYWGIKAVGNQKGRYVITHEVVNKKRIKVKAKFRNFSSLSEALMERAKFTQKGGRYDKAGYFKANSPYEAIVALKNGGYATDPMYVATLISILKSMGIDPYKKYIVNEKAEEPKKIEGMQECKMKKPSLVKSLTALITRLFHKKE